MAEDRHYIAKENFTYFDKEGCSINITIGNQFILLEDLQNETLRLKSIDNDLLFEKEVILPRSILENMSKPSTHEPSFLLRSQSAVKERICSLNFADKDEAPEKCRYSTFGHGSLQDRMSRSTHEPRRSGTLPPTIAPKEKHQNEVTPVVDPHLEKDGMESVAVLRTSGESKKWNRVEENGQAVHVNVDTGDRWHSTTDESGRQYFYHEASRMSTWKLPDDDRALERSFGDEAVRPLDEVLENVHESSDSDVEWQDDESSGSAAADKGHAPLSPMSPVSPTSDTLVGTESLEGGSRFNIRQIKKEHISGPLFNKLIRTERSGAVEKTKSSENGKEVSKKWTGFHMVLTGPELLFYKDVKSAIAKPGLPQGKVDLKLKIQNLQVSEKTDGGGKSAIIQVEDTGAPGSSITYLLKFALLEDMRAWTAALQFAKDWQNEDRYSENAFSGDSATVDDSVSDIQNIGMKLKHLLKKRPTRESLEQRGILKLESVFGSSLDILCEQEKTKVPEFVFRCILAIEARGLHHNGIYRISGNQAKIQKLRLAVDENKYQLNSESMELETLTGAFKSFFKELKEPLFDEEFCSKMVDLLSHRKVDKKQPYKEVNLGSVRKLLSKLRPCHYETARALLGHLHKVASLASKNLMDVSNLSMVWGPNLYLVAGQASTKLAVVLMTHNQIVDFLLTAYTDIFDRA